MRNGNGHIHLALDTQNLFHTSPYTLRSRSKQADIKYKPEINPKQIKAGASMKHFLPNRAAQLPATFSHPGGNPRKAGLSLSETIFISPDNNTQFGFSSLDSVSYTCLSSASSSALSI